MYEFTEDSGNEENGLLVGFEEDKEDIFERHGEDSGDKTKLEKAIGWLHEELQTSRQGSDETQQPPIQSIPVFMGHGTEDDKVPCAIGKLAAEFLRSMDIHTDWKEFEGLGHWYSEEMLRDIVIFLKALKGWKDPDITDLGA